MPAAAMTFFASPVASRTSTPTNVTTSPRQRRHSRSSRGSSSRQGPHHEAQKFRTTTRPAYELRSTWPDAFKAVIENVGASAPRPAAKRCYLRVAQRNLVLGGCEPRHEARERHRLRRRGAGAERESRRARAGPEEHAQRGSGRTNHPNLVLVRPPARSTSER